MNRNINTQDLRQQIVLLFLIFQSQSFLTSEFGIGKTKPLNLGCFNLLSVSSQQRPWRWMVEQPRYRSETDNQILKSPL